MNAINNNRAYTTKQIQHSTEDQDMTPTFNPTMRWIARCILILISFVWYSPYVHASIERITQTPAKNRIENYYPLGAELEALRKTLRLHVQALEAYQQASKHPAQNVSILPELKLEKLNHIKHLDQEVQDEMAANLVHLQSKKLPEKIIERQRHTQAQYQQHMSELFQILETLNVKQDAIALEAQQVQLNKALALLSHPLWKPHESLSNNYDFNAPSARNLLSTQAQINSLLGADSAQYLSTDSGTAISAAIQAKVAELGNDPLALYNWVHDTVRWIPSYGVMQGADYTLQTEQGNAFDTASLLISLLRAAGHEARYKYGIVHAPIEQMRNWIGNVKNADAVGNLLSQGGIPHTQVSYGGAIEEIRFEHVWVEVKDDTNWLPLDPSFKQYTYTEGMDLESAVSFDAQGLLTQLQNSSTSNETEGWVQGVDANLINTELANYQTQLESYLTNNAPNATLGEVLGQQEIQTSAAIRLQDAAPAYDVKLSAVVDQLPESLFYRFHFQVGSAVSFDYGASFQWGSQHFELNELTPNLVGKDIALSFRPATPADEATLESYLPDTITSVEDLPNTLPAGSINMIGELTVDGQVIYSTPEVTLGESLKVRLGYSAPYYSLRYAENTLIAGQYQAIGIDMQGVSPQQLEALQAKLEDTQTKLEASNTQSLTKHDVVGNILQAGIQGYMAMTYATDRIAAQAANVAYYRQPGFGTFSTEMSVSYLLLGVPKDVRFTGVVMDVDQLQNNVEEKQNCYEGWLAFNRASGMRSSAYEHQIPEQLFSTETEQAEGVSTAKALAIAMAQGQRIYTLTSANASQLNFITLDEGARSEIQQALVQGLEVTVHQSPITVNGWQGSGYSVLDPETGVGAYQISGGASGGAVTDTNDSKIDLVGVTGYLEKISEKLNNGLARIAGKLLGELNKIKDAIDIAENCSSNEAIALIVGYAGLGVMWSIGVAAFALFPLVAFFIGMLGVFILGNLLAADIENCKGE
tara:strand:- start:546 stop:3497 length:2952 start_codon:yes stop_codon:yes gene_type:complete